MIHFIETLSLRLNLVVPLNYGTASASDRILDPTRIFLDWILAS